MLEGMSKFINRPTKTGKHRYDKFFMYVPTEVARDSGFPFKEGDVIRIVVDSLHKRVIITKP
jgi:hypothetical protein